MAHTGPQGQERAALAMLASPNWPSLLQAFDDSPVQVVVFVGPDHHLAFQNRASAQALGPRQVGACAEDAFEEYPDYVMGLDHVFASGEPLTLMHSPMTVAPPGSDRREPVLIDASFSALRGSSYEISGVLWQAVDVTSRYADDERLRVATALSRASLDLSRSLEVEQVTATVTRLAADVFSGWGLLDLWQTDGSLRRVGATHHQRDMQPLIEKLKSLPRISGRPDRRPESHSARAARTGLGQLGELDLDAIVAAASSPEHAALMRQLRPRWFMSVPVQIGPRRLGALSVVRPQGEEPFKPADRAILEQFAERAAIALAHARDYDEQRQSALTLQRNLLPVQPLQGDGVQLVVRYQAGGTGSEVGGDWYDVVPLVGGSLGVAVGDVQGHDLAAAALMGQVRAVVHSHAHLGLPPSRIAEEANAFVMGAAGEKLVTLTYLQVYPRERLVVWVRAGHLPALVVSPDGGVEVLLGRGGLPLGVDDRAHWQEETVHLPAGAVLAVFTDGLVESHVRSFDDGVNLLASMLAGRARDDLDVLADDILAQLAVDDARRDDVALVLLRLPDEEAQPMLAVCRRLPPASSSAPLSRRFLRDVLAHWPVADDLAETAALLVTELVSNATRHSDGAIELRISLRPDRLQVSVFDDSHRLPQVSEAGSDDTSGRGLQLVEILSSGWGVQTEDRGKVVWFELELGPLTTAGGRQWPV